MEPRIPPTLTDPAASARSPPKKWPKLFELRRFEQKLGILHRHIVRVQKENLPERRAQNGVWLQFPPLQNPGRMLLSHLEPIHAFHTEFADDPFHFGVNLARAQMPQLNWKITSQEEAAVRRLLRPSEAGSIKHNPLIVGLISMLTGSVGLEEIEAHALALIQ